MNFAVLIPSWSGTKTGGVATYGLNLAETLSSLGHRTDVYARWRENGPDEKPMDVSKSRDALFFIRSLGQMIKNDYEGIVCNDAWYTILPALVCSLRRRANIVYIAHQIFEKRGVRRLRGILFRGLFLLQSLNFIKVVFVSEHMRRHYSSLFGPESVGRAVVIRATPPGEENVTWDPTAAHEFRRKFGIHGGEFLILGLSLTVLRDKARGAAILIQALSSLRGSHPNVKLMLTRGTYDYVPWLKEVAHRCGFSDRVIFPGEIDDPMLALNACDLYVHIVFNEGLPLAVLEAMRAGKPIVAARRGGIPEAVDHEVNGLLVEPEVDQVTAAVKRLLEDDALRSRLGRNAKERAEITTWREPALRYLELLSGKTFKANPGVAPA